MTALVNAGQKMLVEAGYRPEVAYFECLHEMKLIVDLMYHGGVAGMRSGVSDTAEFGDYVMGRRVIGEDSRRAMREILDGVGAGLRGRMSWLREAE